MVDSVHGDIEEVASVHLRSISRAFCDIRGRSVILALLSKTSTSLARAPKMSRQRGKRVPKGNNNFFCCDRCGPDPPDQPHPHPAFSEFNSLAQNRRADLGTQSAATFSGLGIPASMFCVLRAPLRGEMLFHQRTDSANYANGCCVRLMMPSEDMNRLDSGLAI